MSRRSSAVLNPNLGLYLDRSPLALDGRALRDCLNVRIRDGRIVRDNMGWAPFPNAAVPLDLKDPVLGIDNFFPRAGGQFLLFLTTRDIYVFDEATEEVLFLTPRYEVGTVSVTNGSSTVTGSGTSWEDNVKAGDFIHVGTSEQRDPTESWREIASVDSDTQLTLVEDYDGPTESGEDYTIRNVFTGSLRNPWSMEIFPSATEVEGTDGDRWYAVNGVDPVVAWDNTLDQVYFPDLGDLETCRTLARYKNMMIYVGLRVSGEQRPYSIRNSAIGQPENLVTLEASEFVVHDGVDPLVAAIPIGDNLALYGERSITLAQFVGNTVQFVFRTSITGLGPLATRAVADFGDFHEFLGPDAQYRFDGISVQEIGHQVWRDIIRRQSPQRLNMINGHFDEESGELLWIMPLTTDADPEDGPPERAFVEHYLELVGEDVQSPFTVRELPATATGFFSREDTLRWDTLAGTWEEQNFRWNDRFLQAAFPYNLFGTFDGKIFILNEQDSQAGEPITSFARFGRRPLGDIRHKGVVRRVYPFATRRQSATYPLEVRVWLTNDPDGTATLSGTFDYDLTQATSRHFVTPRRSGRYMEVEFRTVGLGRGFEISGYDIDVVPGGGR